MARNTSASFYSHRKSPYAASFKASVLMSVASTVLIVQQKCVAAPCRFSGTISSLQWGTTRSSSRCRASRSFH